MIKILFICLGNICRSPMAEFIFKDLVKRQKLQDRFIIDSAATSREEVGNTIHYGTKIKLEEQGISYTEHRARQLAKEDYDQYDYLVGMEDSNIRNIMRIIGTDRENKVYKLLDFTDKPKDIADPWYTGNFDITYEEISNGCKALLEYCIKNK